MPIFAPFQRRVLHKKGRFMYNTTEAGLKKAINYGIGQQQIIDY